MEEKRNHQPHNEGEANGQRISVRPGNFAPPKAAGGENHAGGEARRESGQGRGDGQNAHRGRNRHRGRSHNRPKGGEGQSAPQNQQGQKPQQSGQRPQQNGQKPQQGGPRPQQNGQKPQQGGQRPQQNGQKPQQGGQNDRRNRRQGRRRDERGGPRREEKQVLSSTLQRELDEEFSTPKLSSTLPSLHREPKKELAVETDEFAVDIATAAYLLEDIPCGFPIPDGKAVEVVGVRFRHAGKVYFFAPGNEKFRIGESAVVDTARGPELGEIVMLNRKIAEKDIIQPLRPVLRRATEKDIATQAENQAKEADALKICAEKIAAHKLDMHLVDAQYAFDGSKLLFYFTSEGRVDFRDLVRDLAGVFRTRIELRQIGIRDESRLIGGLGMCGRPFCCTSFLSDFGQVSIKMAKEQGLSINTSKISGCCGRLMCCLRYEYETYQMEARLTPSKDSLVDTPDGMGTVVDSTPLAGLVKVRLNATPDEAPTVFHRDDITVIPREKPATTRENPSAVDSAELAEADNALLAKESTEA